MIEYNLFDFIVFKLIRTLLILTISFDMYSSGTFLKILLISVHVNLV